MKTLVNAAALERCLAAVERHVNSPRYFGQASQVPKVSLPESIFETINQVAAAIRNPIVFRRRGKFLVVTGLDKVGKETVCFNPRKTTGVQSVVSFLKSLGFNVFALNPPTYGTVMGNLVSAYLGRGESAFSFEGELSDEHAWLLFSLDRAQYNYSLRSWLSRPNSVVLSKGWTERQLAYQMALGIKKARILRFERNLLKQDYTLVLEAPIETLLERLSSDGIPDLYEREPMLRRVFELMSDLARIYPYGEVFSVNASRSVVETSRHVNTKIAELLSQRRVRPVEE